MMKTFLFAVALASLALAGGCAKGGNGTTPPPVTIDVVIASPSSISASALYPTEPVTVKATVSNSTTTAVTWSLSGTNCTGSACGTLTPTTPAPTPATAAYVAPPTPMAGVTITAALTPADPAKTTGTLSITVIDVTTDVAPATLSVGKLLTQTFTAVAVPDAAGTQNFTWSCTANGAQCGTHNGVPNFVVPDAKVPVAYYTAYDNCTTKGCVQISAAAQLASPTACSGSNSNNCTIAEVTPVASRVSGTYAFQFSGFDKNHKPIAVAGTFTVAAGGSISGFEDEMTSSGLAQYSFSGGSYTPISASDPNSNNAGTLALPTGVFPQQYQVVMDGAGDIQMIASDAVGDSGSGIAEPTSKNKFNQGSIQTFAFGFTGVDSTSGRVGYAGLLSTDGVQNITSGLIDVNDAGINGTICSSPPCNVVGSYAYDPIGNRGQLTLSSPASMNFDFFVANGAASAINHNPLTLYVISTDPVATSPAVLGTMVLRDVLKSPQKYDNTLFKGTSVSALTGTATCTAPPCTNVSLTLGTTAGTADSSGNGNFSGQFDQNNGGAILSAAFPPSSGTNNYTYAASSSASGRYTFYMLGDPTKSTPVPPIPFVLYASGANRGFLLEQGGASPPDTSVITGTMSPQGNPAFGFPGSALPSTFAAATTSSGSSAVDAIAANLLLTWVNTGTCTATCVNGTQYDAANPGGVPLAGAYTPQPTGNNFTIALTTPSANYVLYPLDISGCTNQSPVCAVLDFLMMDVDKTNPNASIIFAQQ
jgi:hypothetical protein